MCYIHYNGYKWLFVLKKKKLSPQVNIPLSTLELWIHCFWRSQSPEWLCVSTKSNITFAWNSNAYHIQGVWLVFQFILTWPPRQTSDLPVSSSALAWSMFTFSSSALCSPWVFSSRAFVSGASLWRSCSTSEVIRSLMSTNLFFLSS